jgi:hypothetical protein
MTDPMNGAWRVVARLQKSQILAKSEIVERALDAMIDRQIDRIAANCAEADDLAEARRAVATAARRERHRARLMRLYIVASASDDQSHLFTLTPEASYAARQALTGILAQTSPQDATLLLSVGQGGTPQAPGLTAAAARKRLGRLRARFSDLNPSRAA